jgi:hypothetical protein
MRPIGQLGWLRRRHSLNDRFPTRSGRTSVYQIFRLPGNRGRGTGLICSNRNVENGADIHGRTAGARLALMSVRCSRVHGQIKGAAVNGRWAWLATLRWWILWLARRRRGLAGCCAAASLQGRPSSRCFWLPELHHDVPARLHRVPQRMAACRHRAQSAQAAPVPRSGLAAIARPCQPGLKDRLRPQPRNPYRLRPRSTTASTLLCATG